MAEYIEREALLADIEKRYCQPCEAEGKDYNHVRCRACWVDDMVGEIGDAPFYDVAPVVHGRWLTWSEKFPDFAEANKGVLGVFCTVCNRHSDNKTNYCPHCGARMDHMTSEAEER